MIVGVAILYGRYMVALHRPNRHDAVIAKARVLARHMPDSGLAEAYWSRKSGDCQGFIDDEGRFLTREQAAEHAFWSRQIVMPMRQVCSEDLW